MKKVIENPITEHFRNHLISNKNELYIAVPYISSFAKKILSEEHLGGIKNKKLITCFDENNLNSFELDTLKYLIENGFSILYNNTIHLKLYLFDNIGFISSSNLTKGGFENNIELTSVVTDEEFVMAKTIFRELWEKSKVDEITQELIQENYSKYLLLKKRAKYKKAKSPQITSGESRGSEFDLEIIIDQLFEAKEDYSRTIDLAYKANKEREKVKEMISAGFVKEHFYVPKGHQNRKETLHYHIVHGPESKTSGSGLREDHFKDVANDNQLIELISYIYPPSIGQPDWDLKNEETFREYCNGIFDFNIPQYKVSMPIRLASFFYPDSFIPMFKLGQLAETCSILGYNAKPFNNGDKLFEYNRFLLKRMNSIPYGNYVKMNIAYQLYFILQLKRGFKDGLSFEEIGEKYTKKWERNNLRYGLEIINRNSLDGEE